MTDRTHYETLDISQSFPADAIEGIRASLVPIYHPESGSEPNAARMRQINEACDVLADPERRTAYDQSLKHPRPTGDTSSTTSSTRSTRDPATPAATEVTPPTRPSTSGAASPEPDLARSALRAAQAGVTALSFAGAVAAIAVAAFVWTAFWSGLFSSWQNPIIYIGWIAGAVYLIKEYGKQQ
jgi:curved DNA-binding protein CbpA